MNEKLESASERARLGYLSRFICLLIASMGIGFFALSYGKADMNEKPCTLIVLRHAEKGSGADPELTEQGFKRAQDLAQALRGIAIKGLFCTEYTRTRQTLEPLSKLNSVPIETVSADDAPRWRQVVEQIGAGETVVICGHQNTVPLFIEEAGGEISGLESISGQRWIPGHVFDRLYVVSWSATEDRTSRKAQTLEIRFGQPCE